MLNYSILVNSCDAYKDAWPFFFYLLKKNWTGHDMPEVYLNTENENYENDDINVKVINCNKKDIAWGERLLYALDKISTDHVLMMLEDFYYENPIKVDVIEECVDRLNKDNTILSFQMVPASEVYRDEVKPQKTIYQGFALRERKGTYTFIAGPTLWRKSDLVALTKKEDSPWDFEWLGSMRTQLYGKKIFCWRSFEDPVFDYDIAHGGAIHGGKWVGYKMRELEKKFGFSLNYGDREIEEDWVKNPSPVIKEKKPTSFYEKHIGSRIRRHEYKKTVNKNKLFGLRRRVENWILCIRGKMCSVKTED